MRIFSDLNEWLAFRKVMDTKLSIGFVPTMGCLHAGHLSLLKTAKENNDFVVLSIYVNPTQFNEEKDLQNYPRTLEADLEKAKNAGVDAVILPDNEQMYASTGPSGQAGGRREGVGGRREGVGGRREGDFFQITSSHPWTELAEGSARPGHFTGVLTVVMKLLNLVQATRAYFGEKDYQQCQLIQAMVASFFFPVEIVAVPTVREDSGLALSSRNTLLSAEERVVADRFATEFLREDHSLESLEKALLAMEKIPSTSRGLSAGSIPFMLEYLLEENDRWLTAVRVGKTRLIDNRPSTSPDSIGGSSKGNVGTGPSGQAGGRRKGAGGPRIREGK